MSDQLRASTDLLRVLPGQESLWTNVSLGCYLFHGPTSMNDEDNQDQARDVGKRIASLIRAIGHGHEKQNTGDEQQKLKAAASRLDQMLKASAEADQQALKDAADRLDRLLVDIRKGKDVSNRVKRRRDRGKPTG